MPLLFTPSPGLVIAKTSRARPGTYLLPARQAGTADAPTFPRPALEIAGDGITVDLKGAEIRGAVLDGAPDERAGLGILVRGRNVTIKNARVRGYRVGLLARGAKGLRLVGCDFSDNYKSRLRSTPEKEDLGDWMSYHQNEKNEWLRYGAAIYLDGCDGAEVRGCRVRRGQNALLMPRTNGALVWNNDFSYNSALGIGMYRSSRNRVMHNRLDYNVRGFSYGVYHRGQDSAAILVFEQCSNNVFAYNSATHSGDGFFLWAGQTTMDTGQGGCNDNLVYGNDFSHAPTNGIEATFSRNRFVGNRVHEAFHGVWGGYSYATEIAGNDFADNQKAVAIEHGQDNVIRGNWFDRDAIAVALWDDGRAPDPAWGYPKGKDVTSRGGSVTENRFVGNRVGLDLLRTTGLTVTENVFSEVPVETRLVESAILPGGVNRSGSAGSPEPWRPLSFGGRPLVAPLQGGLNPFLPDDPARRGWKTIFVDEWGPYDGGRPFLTPAPRGFGAPLPGGTMAGSERVVPRYAPAPDGAPPAEGFVRYAVLGPAGRWRVRRADGVTLSANEGTVPGAVDLRLDPDRIGEVGMDLEYVGGATTDALGRTTPAGRPVPFGFSRFQTPIPFDVTFYPWDPKTQDPRENDAWRTNPPLATARTRGLDFAGYGKFAKDVPAKWFATTATGEFELPPGDYTLTVTADDGVRVWLDDVPVVDEWKYQGPTDYSCEVEGGRHRLRVEHFQIDGYAALKLAIRRQ